MTLEGKKKFTATVLAVIASIVGALATQGVIGQGTSESLIQLSAILGPLALGFFYDLIQGRHDQKKEEVKIEVAKAESQKQIVAPVVQYVEEKLAQPFDAQAFADKVKTNTASRYGEVNEFTEFYTARDLGKERTIDHIDQAIDYWSYLYNKGNAAFTKKFSFDFADRFDKKNLTATLGSQTCTFPDINTMAVQKGVDCLAILREMERIEQKRADLERVKQQNLDWNKLPNTAYYWVGEAAHLLFTKK